MPSALATAVARISCAFLATGVTKAKRKAGPEGPVIKGPKGGSPGNRAEQKGGGTSEYHSIWTPRVVLYRTKATPGLPRGRKPLENPDSAGHP